MATTGKSTCHADVKFGWLSFNNVVIESRIVRAPPGISMCNLWQAGDLQSVVCERARGRVEESPEGWGALSR